MRVLISCLVLAALAACASSSPDGAPTPPRTVRVVDGTGNVAQIYTDPSAYRSTTTLELSAETAWPALVSAYGALGIPVANLDSRDRSIGANTRTRGRLGNVRLSTYLDCGRTQGGHSADTYDVHFVVESRLQPGELGTSQVTTLIEATARPSGFAAAPVRCASTGTLERRIVEELRSQARGQAGR